MKLYFAGIDGHVKRLHYLHEFGATKLMLTYAQHKSYNKQLPRFKEMNFDIMFDSGGFSLWKKGINVNILDYCNYLKKNDIQNYINLDVVGNHKQTMSNQKIMESEGLKPIPVFHLGSDINGLKEIVGSGYDYICLGGSVGRNRSVRIKFFEEIFSSFPTHRFHGLGLTDETIVRSFPFYSVDSTTWLMAEKCRKIFNDQNVSCPAPKHMEQRDRLKNTIEYFVNMESC